MTSDVKGYVVRGKNSEGVAVVCDRAGGFENAAIASPAVMCVPDRAAGERVRMLDWRCTDVAIFRVHADGREERRPSYEEALDRLAESEGRAAFADTLLDRDLHIPADILREAEAAEAAARSRGRDPLAALEAAEQRLLASEGWTPGDRGFWTDPDDGTQWPKAGALEFVRRKLAAKKGGA